MPLPRPRSSWRSWPKRTATATRSSSEFGSCPEGAWSGRTGCSTPFCIGSSGSATSRRGGKSRRAVAVASTTGSRPGAGLSSPRNASSGKRWTRRCGASGRRSPFPSGQPTGVSRATATGSLTMQTPRHAVSLEEQIDQWRSYLRRRQAIHSVDVAELEDHLREQVAGLVDAGLATDEAFLVAVKRMGNLDALSREFAREHSDRLWKQLVLVPSDSGELRAPGRTDAIVAFCLAVAAAVAIKVPALFGLQLDDTDDRFLRPQPESLRAAAPDRLLRLETAARPRTLRWLAVAFVAAVYSPTSIPSPRTAPPRCSRRCTCRSRSGWWWVSRTPAAAGARSRAAWTSFDSRASCSSTTS